MKKIIFVFLFVAFTISSVFSQNKNELEKLKRQTENDIELTTKLLNETNKSKEQQYFHLLIIKKRISLRNKLIITINKEIIDIEKKLIEKNKLINSLEKKLKKLKDEYAKLVYYSFKNKNKYEKWMFILSSENFNQAYRRIKYFEQYSKYRKKQAALIVNTVKTIKIEVEDLKKEKNKKQKLIERKLKEKNELKQETKIENRDILALQIKESELRKKIKKIEKRKLKIEKEINEIIKKEAEKNSYFKKLDDNENNISLQFGRNIGKLMWPVKNGLIIESFGEHDHAVIKGVRIKNEGIDIKILDNINVYCIFDGEVKKVFAIPGANMSVIVRHGHYLTVYSNIVNVRVKAGDKLKKNTIIGEVFNNNNNEDSKIFHFRIYKENKTLNPELWLAKSYNN